MLPGSSREITSGRVKDAWALKLYQCVKQYNTKP